MFRNRRGHSPLFLASTSIAALILFPTVMLLSNLFESPTETWVHIREVMVSLYVNNTLVLLTGVGVSTAIVGTFLSWGLAAYDFGQNRLRKGILLLPMAIPPYIAGYVYSGIFNYSGTLERIAIRFEWSPLRIDIMSMGGAIFIFTIFLMPYVILVSSAFFNRLPITYFESARILGKNEWQTFFQVILPMGRGVVFSGVLMVLLEVLNDYGLVSYFGIPVFSTGIYAAWFGFGDLNSAIRLSVMMMGFVFILLSVEQGFRASKRVSPARALAGKRHLKKANPIFAALFHCVYIMYILAGVVIPVLQMIIWSLLSSADVLRKNLFTDLWHTIFMAALVTVVILICGLVIGNFHRLHRGRWSNWISRIVILGYSIPAPIIAVAALVSFVRIDQAMKPLYQALGFGNRVFSGTVFMLIFALALRYMAIGYNSLNAGLEKLGKRQFEASKTLGASSWKSFWLIDFPQMKPAVFAAVLLTFIDVLKELPLTLILRPFNYDTIATRVFTYAGDEMIHEASVYALMIVGISMMGLMALYGIQKESKL